MPVDPKISNQIIDAELLAAEPATKVHGWNITRAPNDLTIRLQLKSKVDNEVYFLEILCDDYKELPPRFDFTIENGGKGISSSNPESTDSFFHASLLICFPFNRGAYQTHGGPHADWALTNWQSLCPEFTNLGDMLLLIQSRIDSPFVYKGRRQ